MMYIPRITFLAILLVALVGACASAQDLYKSSAEMLNAAALSKQADAAIINALANYGKAHAEACKVHEERREKGAHNDLLEAEIYYKKRAQYQAHRAAQRANPVSPGYAQGTSAAAAQFASAAHQTESGELRWPTLFKAAAYDLLRRQIDRLLKTRTLEDSGVGSQNCGRTLAAVGRLKIELRDNIRNHVPSDYVAARRFLDIVVLEAQRPLTSLGDETLDRVAGR